MPVRRHRAMSLAVACVVAAAPAVAADIDIDKIAGVYKKQFRNGNISGDKYDSEDILEIVKTSPSTAYVKTHLEFFNGHVCNIYGVADVKGSALVYSDRTMSKASRANSPWRLSTARSRSTTRTAIAPSALVAIAACTTAPRST
jgi:hypothetical protein